MKYFFSLFLFTSLIINSSMSCDLNGGIEDYLKKKYSSAFDKILDCAKNGDTQAQGLIGSMYLHGQGTSKNSKKAIKWLKNASKKGHKTAQYDLGLIYLKGDGTRKNYIAGLKWLIISLENGNKKSEKIVMQLLNNMNAKDIDTAKRNARLCIENNYKRC